MMSIMRLVSSFLLIISWNAVTSTSIDLDAADQYGCSFDVGVCGWTIEGPVYNGPGGCDHGWPNNAFNGTTALGAYMCFFLEHLPTMGRARLTSPTVNTTHHVVMSFAVGTVRPPTGTYLNVFLMTEDGTERLLWSTSHLLSPWQRVQIGVLQSGPYQIVIEGIPDPPFFPNFGIDGFTINATDLPATTSKAIQTHESSTELVTTLPTSSQDDTTFPMTSTKQRATIPTTIRRQTTIFPTTSTQDNTTFPMTSIRDTSTVPTTSSKGETTELPTTKATGKSLQTTHRKDTTSDISLYPTSKAASFPRSTLPKGTTQPSAHSKTLSTRSGLELIPTKAAQRGNNDEVGASPVPIALGTTGGVVVVVIAAFGLWKKYTRKAVVSPEKTPEDHDQLCQTELSPI
ncbi:location of vulva defective 1-like [Branchiostoma lanceolatum]|uniref:location of vulva defective 1-like n=1 Tax=Branchiostoma lanceolatum TaxID=7740 RepID=UPI003456A731